MISIFTQPRRKGVKRSSPDERLEDRGGTLPRFVERDYLHKTYHQSGKGSASLRRPPLRTVRAELIRTRLKQLASEDAPSQVANGPLDLVPVHGALAGRVPSLGSVC